MNHRSWIAASSFACLLGLFPGPASAKDWPQFLGPDRNLVTTATNLNLNWPGGDPPLLWRREIGSGWSSPVISGGRLVLHHRLGNEEVVTCLDPLTAEPKWEYRTPTDYRDSLSSDYGPRATPAIADGKVYTFGASGILNCLDLENGHLRWTVDTRKQFEADEGFFGLDCSPLIEDGLVLMQIGGRDEHGIVAFDAGTGRVRWHATDHEAGYSSPVTATIGGQRQALFFTRKGLVAADPKTGRIIFQFPWRSRQNASVNAASPVVVGQSILLSASYETGAVLLRVVGETVRPFWQGDDILSSHYATPVYHRGLLFGFHGRIDYPTGAELRCVDGETGKVLWQLDPIRSGTLLLVNDLLLVMTESGEFFVAPASSKGFKPVARAQLLGRETRAYAAFANGIYYARGKDKLLAVDLRQPPAPPAK